MSSVVQCTNCGAMAPNECKCLSYNLSNPIVDYAKSDLLATELLNLKLKYSKLLKVANELNDAHNAMMLNFHDEPSEFTSQLENLEHE